MRIVLAISIALTFGAGGCAHEESVGVRQSITEQEAIQTARAYADARFTTSDGLAFEARRNADGWDVLVFQRYPGLHVLRVDASGNVTELSGDH